MVLLASRGRVQPTEAVRSSFFSFGLWIGESDEIPKDVHDGIRVRESISRPDEKQVYHVRSTTFDTL